MSWANEGAAHVILLSGAVAALVSGAGTGGVLLVARRRGLLESVNERSSHHQPTPSSGGVAIVAAISVVLGAAAVAGADVDLGLLSAAVLAAGALGLCDDRRNLRAGPKMLAMVGLAVALLPLGIVASVQLPFVGTVSLGYVAIPLTLLWTSCLPHAFNFMDGIDGIAAVSACAVATAFAWWGVGEGHFTLALIAAAIAGATLGFLPWNFPRARIFMGDAGSLPLGLSLAMMAVLAHRGPGGAAELQAARQPAVFPAAVILLSPLLFDVAFTLVRRALAGKRLTQAHREHLYQRLARACGAHPPATLAYTVMVGLMMPAAWCWLRGSDLVRAGVLLAVGGLLAVFAWVVLRLERRSAEK